MQFMLTWLACVSIKPWQRTGIQLVCIYVFNCKSTYWSFPIGSARATRCFRFAEAVYRLGLDGCGPSFKARSVPPIVPMFLPIVRMFVHRFFLLLRSYVTQNHDSFLLKNRQEKETWLETWFSLFPIVAFLPHGEKHDSFLHVFSALNRNKIRILQNTNRKYNYWISKLVYWLVYEQKIH